MTDDRTARPGGARVIGVATALVVLVLIALVVLFMRQDDEAGPAVEELTATPMASATDTTASPPATDETVATPTDDATATPATTPTATDAAPAEPGDAEAAAAAEAIRPAGAEDSQVVVADLDSDGRPEVVVASLLGGRSRIDVASWADGAYEPAYSGEGGAAEVLAEVRVENINDSPDTSEIVVRQTSGTEGESISLWGLRDGQVIPLAAVDGCWDGSHTYGIVGATLDGQRITATCDGSPDPIISWPSDTYLWEPELEAFAYERTLTP